MENYTEEIMKYKIKCEMKEAKNISDHISDTEDSRLTNKESTNAGIKLTRSGLNIADILPSVKNCSDFENAQKDEILHHLETNEKNNLNQAVKCLNDFMPKNFKETLWVYVSICGIFLLRKDLNNVIPHYKLLNKFRLQVPWDDPVHIHLICSKLWPFLEDDKDVIFLSRKIYSISLISRNIAESLIWAVIFRVRDIKIAMFRPYQFTKMLEILDKTDKSFYESDYSRVYSFFEGICFLQNALILNKPYECIIKDHIEDLERLFQFVDPIKDKLELDISGRYMEDRAMILRLLTINILRPLENFLNLKSEEILSD